MPRVRPGGAERNDLGVGLSRGLCGTFADDLAITHEDRPNGRVGAHTAERAGG
jgi:hypothetical protein